MGTTQWGHCPSGAASPRTGKSRELKLPGGGEEPGLSPPQPLPVPAEPLNTGAALSCPGSCLHLSAGRVPSRRAARDGSWGWSCRTPSCACPGCGQPPGAISRQTAVGAGSSLFTGAVPVMSCAPWAAAMRLLQVPLPQQRGWESPRPLSCPRRGCSQEMGQRQERSSTRSLGLLPNEATHSPPDAEPGSGTTPLVSHTCDTGASLLMTLLRMWDSQPVSEWAPRCHPGPSVLSHSSAAPFPPEQQSWGRAGTPRPQTGPINPLPCAHWLLQAPSEVSSPLTVTEGL